MPELWIKRYKVAGQNNINMVLGLPEPAEVIQL